ncbi:hypothetical protein MKEN_00241900 [Mycena kentingensis (nom. inval.)]|nr:hypothetical protein MKEN_00241900 [Mycena kentingensis (nom. inval.)]
MVGGAASTVLTESLNVYKKAASVDKALAHYSLPAVAPLKVTPRKRSHYDALPFGATQQREREARRIHSAPVPARPKVRPLPKIPDASTLPQGPKSAPGVANPPRPPLAPRRTVSSQCLRPLPSVPEMETSKAPLLPVSTVPPAMYSTATVTPRPSLDAIQIQPLPVPPSPGKAGSRFATLSLKLQLPTPSIHLQLLSPQTPVLSPDASVMSLSPPPTPGLMEPPSPNTAVRRRISKLRRHLGQSVQLDLFGEEGHEADVCAQTANAVRRLLDLDSSSGSDDDEESDEEQYAFVLTTGDAQCELPIPNRYSRKWIREKGGQRWVEENYSDILRDLRAL